MKFIHGPADIGGILLILASGPDESLELLQDGAAHIVHKLLGVFGEVIYGISDHPIELLNAVGSVLTGIG